jgi:carbonic anhydrase
MYHSGVCAILTLTFEKDDNVKALYATLVAISLLSTGAQAQDATWSYSGPNGPQNWYSLSGAYSQCRTGQFQSPINIEGTEPAVMHHLDPQYDVAPIDLKNEGLGVAMTYSKGSQLHVGKKIFSLNRLTFHTPAEHTIVGISFPLSIQFLHTATDGSTAMVVSLVTEGNENQAIKEYLPYLPLEIGQRNRRSDILVNARDLMPADKSYYRYAGSLTTPPCTEGVSWYVLKHSIQMSKEQIAMLKGVIGADNARPLQPRGNRMILDARGQ